jgi:rhodanese-related sulfurtransferase
MNDRLCELVGLIFLFGSLPCGSSCADQKACGVEAAFGAVHALGMTPEVNYSDLLTKEYISELSGSTASDICKLVGRLGGEAVFLEGLGWASLQSTNHPLILHVSSDGQLEASNHWLLFLGVRDNMAKVVDGGGTVEEWPWDRLLARWRGRAIVVTPKDDASSATAGLNFAETSFAIGLAIGAVALGLVLSNLRPSGKFSFPIVFIGVALGLCIAMRLSSRVELAFPVGMTGRYVFAAIDGPPHETIDLSDFNAWLARPGNITFIDCRYRADFLQSPIPGTISIPVDAKTHEIVTTLEGKDRSQPIVIFCASDRCRFSEFMAVRLTGLGFTDLRIFRGGYAEWLHRSEAEA